MTTITIGDVRLYYESGEVYKVEIMGIENKSLRYKNGEGYTLRLLEIIKTAIVPSFPIGLEFSVWKAEGADVYEMWYLSQDNFHNIQ